MVEWRARGKALLFSLGGLLAAPQTMLVAWVVVLVLPGMLDVRLPMAREPHAFAVAEAVRALPPGAAVVIAIDAAPGSRAELLPSLVALGRGALARQLRLVVVATRADAAPLVDTWVDELLVATGAREGSDLVSLGFIEGQSAAIAQLGESFAHAKSVDRRGVPLKALPALISVDRLAAAGLVVIASDRGAGIREWVGQTAPLGLLALGAIGGREVVPEALPFVGSGQLVGVVAGTAGAATLEAALGTEADAGARLTGVVFAAVFLAVATAVQLVAAILRRRRLANEGGAS